MRGRPKIDDVRDKLYRVRVNDEEEQMLGYICYRNKKIRRIQTSAGAILSERSSKRIYAGWA